MGVAYSSSYTTGITLVYRAVQILSFMLYIYIGIFISSEVKVFILDSVYIV